jgi:hypothetical protein
MNQTPPLSQIQCSQDAKLQQQLEILHPGDRFEKSKNKALNHRP